MLPQLMGPMDCRTFRKRHLEYLDDTLSGDQMASAQRHILACDGCAAHDTMVRRSLMVARSMRSIEPSAAFQQKLQARLAECRQERQQQIAQYAQYADVSMDQTISALIQPLPASRLTWRSPRTLAALAAGALIGTMAWQGLAPTAAPVIAMQPVIATQPARPELPMVSSTLLQAMVSGNPVWPATVIIDEMPTQFVNTDYSISQEQQ